MENPLRENDVRLELSWKADRATELALQRQSSLMGFASPSDYLHQLIASSLASNEADTYVSHNGTLTWDRGLD